MIAVRQRMSVAATNKLSMFEKLWSTRKPWSCSCGWKSSRHSTRHRYTCVTTLYYLRIWRVS